MAQHRESVHNTNVTKEVASSRKAALSQKTVLKKLGQKLLRQEQVLQEGALQ